MLATAANAGAYVSGYIRTMQDSEYEAAGTTVKKEIGFFDQLNLDLVVGYKFNNGLRIEADVMKTVLKDKNDDDAFLATDFGLGEFRALYDIKVGGKLTPYFGVGLGGDGMLADQFGSGLFYYDGGFAIRGSLVAGVKFEVANNFALDAQYARRMEYINPDSGKSSNSGYDVVRLGGIYSF